jgi:uncharacterized protein
MPALLLLLLMLPGLKGAAMNHLKGQKSPYLLQHVSNPVDWYPWGEEAFEKARREDKPIFLSIGYSTCHWCHVMETESFANPRIAALMNDVFVSIKVDREERPDLDEHFMAVCQMLTGSGGWPLTIVLTPDREVFFATTYIPGESAYGRTGMTELVPKIGELWKSRRGDIVQSAASIGAEVAKAEQTMKAGFSGDPGAVHAAAASLAVMFDSENGGFGTAPKFPMPTLFPLLLRSWKKDGNPRTLAMVEKTLTAMRNGGIFDQLGFGFHRYSTDARWLVPHFEKMLYDQALLTLAYTEAWQATGNDFYQRTAREILAYVRRDLALPGGGFATAEDADSQGVEGKYYLWTAEEAQAALEGGSFAILKARYGISGTGNFSEQGGGPTGENILHRSPSDSSTPGEAESQLLSARAGRVRPLRDDKVLADGNGLMIAAMARAGSAFNDPQLIGSAGEAARFILERMGGQHGRLLHRWRDGEAAIGGFADDYAFLAWGLLELYQAGFDVQYLEQAIELTDGLLRHFWDGAGGGFFQTADDAADSLPRRKSFTDGVIPSANSVGLMLLMKLNRITGNGEYERKAEAIARLFPKEAPEHAISYSWFLCAADFLSGPTYEVVISGDPEAPDTQAMLRAVRARLLPGAVVILRPAGAASSAIARLAPFTAAQEPIGGRATAYVCTNFVCALPTNDIGVMLRELGEK